MFWWDHLVQAISLVYPFLLDKIYNKDNIDYNNNNNNSLSTKWEKPFSKMVQARLAFAILRAYVLEDPSRSGDL